jgi:hypothetical protein
VEILPLAFADQLGVAPVEEGDPDILVPVNIRIALQMADGSWVSAESANLDDTLFNEALPITLFVGGGAIIVLIDAVETFVDHHYEAQVRKLPDHGPGGALRALLIACQADEVEHRDQARAAGAAATGRLTQAWQWLVGTGSALAVMAARRV